MSDDVFMEFTLNNQNMFIIVVYILYILIRYHSLWFIT